MPSAYLHRIATATPAHDVHEPFVNFAAGMLEDERTRTLFERMAARSALSIVTRRCRCTARWGRAQWMLPRCIAAAAFPNTGERMRLYKHFAPALLRCALDRLALTAEERSRIRHVLITSCTGLYAPGLDFAAIEHLGLDPQVERTVIGFMGCYAAINALKQARHIVRSQPDESVLVVNLELCTLHMQETQDLGEVLSFLVFADGCAASLVSSEPGGIALDGFRALHLENTEDLITWHIGNQGFDMVLSGAVPGAISKALRHHAEEIRNGHAVDLWAVHPGGRSVLDAVEDGLQLPAQALAASRSVLRKFGNMSSATVMFVLQRLMGEGRPGSEAAQCPSVRVLPRRPCASMSRNELDFTHRAHLEEWMDGPCTYEEFRACLRDLAQVNRVTFAYRPTLRWLEQFRTHEGEAPLHIVDVGCGGGDMLRRIARWAHRRKLPVRLTGIDLNPYAARAAREFTPRGTEVEWITGDAFSYQPDVPVDLVLSSLFTHHLPDAEIVRFLRWMESIARYGWFLNDLHREELPFRAFGLLASVARWHRFVRHDGPVSIRRAFRAEDWRSYLHAAGMDHVPVSITPYRPARLCVGRVKA